MLRLTKKADYSLIALRHYAARRAEQSTEVAISAKELADCCGIPLPILSKLLQKLTKSGFLTAEYGTNGGYRLAVDPAKISILEVIRAIDGPIVLANCFTAGAFCAAFTMEYCDFWKASASKTFCRTRLHKPPPNHPVQRRFWTADFRKS
jgi:Rrf2 family protein